MAFKALVAMSGGVDSSVAAMLAIGQGVSCTGATMVLHSGAKCGVEDARAAAERLMMPFRVFDFSDCFAERVVSKFVTAYSKGRTPNPCVDCNKHIKFGRLLDEALSLGNDYLVTGHYAQVSREGGGRFLLRKGADLSKDQSYVLYSLTQSQLAHIQFPLGCLSKAQVRALALSVGLENARRDDSQDICFVPDGDYVKFIVGYTGEQPRSGRFVDVDGNDLGQHKGLEHYTVGQRRGLGLAMPHPSYVLEIRPDSGQVVVGRDEMLFSKKLNVAGINLIPADKLDAPVRAHVKIRYTHREQPATVYQTGEDTLQIVFDEPQRAITKGQAAVIYDGQVVVGGGTIV